jgi:hypothetical protein
MGSRVAPRCGSPGMTVREKAVTVRELMTVRENYSRSISVGISGTSAGGIG